MNKRLKKKRYQRYVSYVLSDVLESEACRQAFGAAKPYSPVELDVSTADIFEEDTIAACKQYGLRFVGYRTEKEEGTENTCLVVILPDDPRFDMIVDAAYDDLDLA